MTPMRRSGGEQIEPQKASRSHCSAASSASGSVTNYLFERYGPASLTQAEAIVTQSEEQALFSCIDGVELTPFRFSRHNKASLHDRT
jgi:hypothetical protein